MPDQKQVFQDVDASGVAPELMAYLDRVAALPEMRQMRQDSYRLMGLQPGEAVVDVGCGLGHALAEMADLVGPEGRVVGIDLSRAMAEEAARRVTAPHVDVRVGDLLDLDLPDGSLDGVRAERVFQHVTETARACAEVARVLRPGGRAVILDPDWSSLRIVGPPRTLVEENIAAWIDRHPNPTGVLGLPDALRDAGFAQVDIVPTLQVHSTLAEAAQKIMVVDEGIPAEHWPLPAERRDSWFAAVRDADRDGRFWCSIVAWTLVARLR